MTPRRRRIVWASIAVPFFLALVVGGGLGLAHLSLRQGEAALATLTRDPLPRSVGSALDRYRRARRAFERARWSPLHRDRARQGLDRARQAMGDLVERGLASGRFSPRDAPAMLGILPALGWTTVERAELALRLGRFREALDIVKPAPSREACRLGLAAALALADAPALRRQLLCLASLPSRGSRLEREASGLLWLALGEPRRAATLLGEGRSSPERIPLFAEAERLAGRHARARQIIREAYDDNEASQPLLRLVYLRTLAHGPQAPEALPWIGALLGAEDEDEAATKQEHGRAGERREDLQDGRRDGTGKASTGERLRERNPQDATQQALFAAVLARHGRSAAAERRLRRFVADAPLPAADALSSWLPLYALQSRSGRTDLKYVHLDDLAPPIALAESLLSRIAADAVAAEPFRECLGRLRLLEAIAALLLYDAPLAERALVAAEKHGAPSQPVAFLRAVGHQVNGDHAALEAALGALAPEAPSVARPWQALLAMAKGDETRARALLKAVTEAQRAHGPRLGRHLHRMAEDLLAARRRGHGQVPALSPTLAADWPSDPVVLRRDLPFEVLSAPRGLAAPPEAVFVLFRSHPSLRSEAPALFGAPLVPKVRAGEQLLRAHLAWLWARSRGDHAAAERAEALLSAHRRLARAAPFYSAWWSLFLW